MEKEVLELQHQLWKVSRKGQEGKMEPSVKEGRRDSSYWRAGWENSGSRGWGGLPS